MPLSAKAKEVATKNNIINTIAYNLVEMIEDGVVKLADVQNVVALFEFKTELLLRVKEELTETQIENSIDLEDDDADLRELPDVEDDPFELSEIQEHIEDTATQDPFDIPPANAIEDDIGE